MNAEKDTMTAETKATPNITRAAERYLEQYGDPLVMNTYLKLTILVHIKIFKKKKKNRGTVPRTIWRPARDEYLSQGHHPRARRRLFRAGGADLQEPEQRLPTCTP